MQHEQIKEALTKVRELFPVKNWQSDLESDLITIHSQQHLSLEQSAALQSALELMICWRQGPYQLFDVKLDTEWQSNIKWQRLKQILPDIQGKQVADVGCSNGFFMFKLLALNPAAIYGFDPFKICHYQFQLLNHFIDDSRLRYVTEGVEQLPYFLEAFDLILMMGVLYHRREPVQSLRNLYNSLRVGGDVILETMVLPGNEENVVPVADRYSKMKNIYYLTNLAGLAQWALEAGFKQTELLSVSQTSCLEQRTTPYAPYESLAEFLDPTNSDCTIEGWPAPRRAIVRLKK